MLYTKESRPRAVGSNDKYLIAVETHYENQHISALNFECRHREECANDCPGFVGPSEAYIGRKYGKKLPRLLFVSLDPGCSHRWPKYRTTRASRERQKIYDPINDPSKNRHWYRTYELAATLLKPFECSLDISTIGPFFSHTTSAKCSSNLDTHGQGSLVKFRNCRAYLKGEIEAFDPHIIVTQGKLARMALESNFLLVRLYHTPKRIVAKGADAEHGIIEVSGAPVLWIPTHHPRNWGLFNAQRRHSYDHWADCARRFIDEEGDKRISSR